MKDYRERKRHKIPRRKIKGYGAKSKSADSVKGEFKMHEGGNKTREGRK